MTLPGNMKSCDGVTTAGSRIENRLTHHARGSSLLKKMPNLLLKVVYVTTHALRVWYDVRVFPEARCLVFAALIKPDALLREPTQTLIIQQIVDLLIVDLQKAEVDRGQVFFTTFGLPQQHIP